MNSPIPNPIQNPYAAPQTVSHADVNEYGEVNIFSTRGRLGRVRYIGYTIAFSFLVLLIGSFIVGMIAAVIRPQEMSAIMTISLLPYVFVYAIQIWLTIQRCHDFNFSGWLSVLIIIPLVGFIFWFIPGTNGPNRWGHKTPPNTTTNIVLALVVPVVAIFLIGVLAAIAIPQYQTYAKRAAEAAAKAK
jgi:uncharacterized membrane protein YhaH (DUF805 family)